MNEKIFSLEDLSSLTGISVRTIRYYIQMGLVDRPLGERRTAHYKDQHLEQLLQIKKLTSSGFSLERIKDILTEKEPPEFLPRPKPGSIIVKSHLMLAPGLELVISPEESEMDPEKIRVFSKEVMDLVKKIFKSADEKAAT